MFWIKEYIGYEIIQKEEHSHIKQALNRLLPSPNILVLGNTTSKREAILSFLVYPSSPYSSQSPLSNVVTKKIRGFQSVTKRRKPLHGPFVAKLLNDLFGIQARGGCACAGPYGHGLLNVDESHSLAIRSIIKKGHIGVKPGWTRISFPYYMSNEELEFILKAVEFIATYGQRFLPLYHFDWYSADWTIKKKMVNEIMLLNSMIINKFRTCELSPRNIKSNFKTSTNEILGHKYREYLDIAKLLVDCLPIIPSPHPIPIQIDPDIVFFVV